MGFVALLYVKQIRVSTNYKSELATNSEQREQYNVYIREKKIVLNT